MKILIRSLLHSLLLFVTIFLISATVILYTSPGEAETISQISTFSFSVAMPFFIFMFISIYFILNNKENNKGFWKRFLIFLSTLIVLTLILFITTAINSNPDNPEEKGFALVFLIFIPIIFLTISFLLTMLYKFMFRYTDRLIVYLLVSIILASILAIILSIVMHGGCLSGNTNCNNNRILEKALEENNINLCKGNEFCYASFYTTKDDVTLCLDLPESGSRIYNFRNNCYFYFAEKNQDPLLCESISHDNLKNSCFKELANQLDNASLCAKLSGMFQEEKRSECCREVLSINELSEAQELLCKVAEGFQ